MAVCKRSDVALEVAVACKPSGMTLRKTRMCKFHVQGFCTSGSACRFAHQPSELQIPPNLRKTQLCIAFARNGTCRDGHACKYAHGEHDLRVNLGHEKDNSDDFGSDVWSRQTTEDALDAVSLSSFDRQTTTCSDTLDDLLSDDVGERSASDSDSEMNDPDSSHTTSSPDELVLDDHALPVESKVPGAVFRKTKLCKFFANGFCSKGTSCNFAHEQCSMAPQPDLFRTRLCFAFARSGMCRDGDACKYAHGEEQLRNCMAPAPAPDRVLALDAQKKEQDAAKKEKEDRLEELEKLRASAAVQNNPVILEAVDNQIRALYGSPTKHPQDSSESQAIASRQDADSAPPAPFGDTKCSRFSMPAHVTSLHYTIKNTFVQVAMPASPKPLRRSRSADCLIAKRNYA